MLITKNKKRIIAILFFSIVSYALSTSIIKAQLTSGPTAPEYLNFEPVDATDMVNLLTGDFSYNLPLVNVPGPDGDYSMSLSYHSGIKPDEEASWVGLGWSLTPGAINRFVSGFPDDSYTMQRDVYDFWEGGTSTELSIGVRIPTPVGTFMGSLSITDDTYMGSGGGMSLGYSTGLTEKIGASGSISVSSNNKMSISGGIGVGVASAAVSSDGNIGVNGSIGILSYGMGASMSTQGGLSAGINLPINTKSVNKNSGNIKTHTESNGIDLYFIHGSKSYTNYFMSEWDKNLSMGSLYPYSPISKNMISDSYSLADANNLIESNPDYMAGGSVPAYDVYSVSGQGIGGYMQPYTFDNLSGFRINERKIDKDDNNNSYDLIKYNSIGNTLQPDNSLPDKAKKVHFRFKDDFSNSLTIQGDLAATTTTQKGLVDNLIGVYNVDNETKKYFDATRRLGGGRHVEWFTNGEIKDYSAKNAGFISYEHDAYSRTTFTHGYWVIDQIGGFKITNTSGVTYHYSLPVYSYGEHTHTIIKNTGSGDKVHDTYNSQPYAYTWLLTAVTGPDFVDRGGLNGQPNGRIDDNDWGYWVKFDYGCWTDKYTWRTPFEGMDKDKIADMKSYSSGKKELYYLDFISTRSHTALFVKSVRDDGYAVTNASEGGCSYQPFTEKVLTYFEITYQPVSEFKLLSEEEFNNENKKPNNVLDRGRLQNSGNKRVPILKLDEIIIIKNDQLTKLINVEHQNFKTLSKLNSSTVAPEDYNKIYNPASYTIIAPNPDYEDSPFWYALNRLKLSNCGLSVDDILSGAKKLININWNHLELPEDLKTFKPDIDRDMLVNADDVLDNYDFLQMNAKNLVYEKAEKTINLVSNYSLCLGTPNNINTIQQRFDSKSGKLSLKKVEYYGLNHQTLIPPVSFTYDDSKNKRYMSSHYRSYDVGTTSTVKAMQDIWGYFKSDFIEENELTDKNWARMTTDVSAVNVDVWSLSSISSPMGASMSIKYESDSYNDVLKDLDALIFLHIDAMSLIPANGSQSAGVRITVKEPNIFALLKDQPIKLIDVDVTALQIKFFDELDNSIGQKCCMKFQTAPVAKNGLPYTISGSSDLIIYDTDLASLFNLGSGSVTSLNDIITADNSLFNAWHYGGIIGGLIAVHQQPKIVKKGGGLRVKEISVDGQNSKKLSTQYSYFNGWTSYEPLTLPLFKDNIHSKTLSIINLYANLNVFEDPSLPSQLVTLGYPSDYFENLSIYHSTETSLVKIIDNTQKHYYKVPYNKTNNIIINSQLLPGSGVCYEKVIVQQYADNNFSNKTENNFWGLTDLKKCPVDPISVPLTSKPTEVTDARMVTIKDLSSHIGLPLTIKVYNESNAVISQQNNTYLFNYSPIFNIDDYETKLKNDYNNQGRIEQAFYESKSVFGSDYLSRNYLVVTKKIDFPSVLIKQETVNMITGIKEGTTYLGYDFFSGQPVETLITDGLGNTFLSHTDLAYHIYPEMGSIALPRQTNQNYSNKNMLTQVAGSYLYKVTPVMDNSTTPAKITSYTKDNVVSATVQTWSNLVPVLSEGSNITEPSVWRKLSSYNWKGDDNLTQGLSLYSSLSNDEFSYWNNSSPPSSSKWEKINEITLYDPYSFLLEAKDINSNYSCIKRGGQHGYSTILSANNASYNEVYYSGAEEVNSEVKYGGGLRWNSSPVLSHSGEWSLQVGNKQGFNVSVKNATRTKYFASVWVYLTSAALEAQDNKQDYIKAVKNVQLRWASNNVIKAINSLDETKKSGSWYLLELVIDKELSCNEFLVEVVNTNPSVLVFMDDFRVHPYQSTLNTYSYDNHDRLTYILNNDNLYTRYEYDEIGRLYQTFQEIFSPYKEKKISQRKYNYKVLNQ